MFFSAPLLLLALIPWAGIVVWMLRGRGEMTAVPFVDLWRGPATTVSRRRRMRLPSAAVTTVLAAIALAVVGAAGPHLRMGLRTAPITIIVDRGVTMMPQERLDETLALANRRLLEAFASDSPVKLIVVPGGKVIRTTLADWLARARELPPLAVSSEGQIAQTVMRELSRRDGLLVVVSDRTLTAGESGAVQFFPKPVRDNVAIIAIGARSGKQPQVMVTLRNQSNRTHAQLKIETGKNAVTKKVLLPGRGQKRAYFFDVAALGSVVEASLAQKDEFPLDNRAWVGRERLYPRIDLRPGVLPEVRRIVAAYLETHPPKPVGPVIVVSSRTLERGESGVIVPNDLRPAAKSASIEIRRSPLTANLALTNLKNLSLGQLPGGQGWQVVMSDGSDPLVAVRQTPARQAWVGFSSPGFATTADFVVLWTNVLDDLSGNGEQYAWHPPGPLTTDWKPVDGSPPHGVTPGLWPGVYRRVDGAMLAVDLPPVSLPQSLPPNVDHIADKAIRRAGAVDLTAAAIIAALACLLVASLLWPAYPSVRRPPRTPA